MNRKQIQIGLWLLALIFLCSCGSVSPVISQYEKAGTLKKGNFELMGNITGYSAALALFPSLHSSLISSPC
jgi:hypothetical protein